MRIRSADSELVCRDPHLGLRHHWSLEAGSVQRAVELRTFSFVVFPPVTLTKRCPSSGFRAESDRNFRAAFRAAGFLAARAAGFFFKSVPRRSSAFEPLFEPLFEPPLNLRVRCRTR